MVAVSELCLAVKQGNLDSVKVLLSNGTSVNEKDENGDNALHWAVFRGHTRLVEELMARGVDWTVRSGKAGYSVLHEAAWDGSTDILTVLLLHGIDANMTSANGCTAVHEAAYRGHLEFLQLLVAGGGNLYSRCSEGKTPLDWARLARQTEVVQWLEIAMTHPLRLQSLCTMSIRQALRGSLCSTAPSLPLPPFIIKTVLYGTS